MKVLWIALVPHPMETHEIHPQPWVKTLRDELSKQEAMEITFLHITNHPAIQFSKDGYNYVFLKGPRPRYDILTLYKLKQSIMFNWLKKHHIEYDLIHVHGSEHNFERNLWKLKTPFIVSIQGIVSECLPYYYGKSLLKRRMFMALQAFYEKYCMAHTPNFMGRTEWDKSVVNKNNPKATYFHADEILRQEFYNAEKVSRGNTIVHVGGKLATKELYFALSVLNRLHLQEMDVSLRIIGSGCELVIDEWKKNNKDHINWKKVEICGFLNAEQMIEAFQRSLCLIHPSRIDNSPNSVCEAQMLGVPVLATPVGGVPTLIKDGETGFLLGRDLDKYVKQIRQLWEDSKLWESISIHSRQEAFRRHNPEKCVREVMSAYYGIIER